MHLLIKISPAAFIPQQITPIKIIKTFNIIIEIAKKLLIYYLIIIKENIYFRKLKYCIEEIIRIEENIIKLKIKK